MNRVKDNILATLAYFDLFKYPLTGAEIYLFLKEKADKADFDMALKYLVAGQQVYQFGKFYTLCNDHRLIIRRYSGNKKASDMINIATRISETLIKFPYVRGIAISGTVSKNFADENSDIHLFIITAKNRLWIARTLMHAFRKLTRLLNKQDYFCMNYFVDQAQLEIKEKNFYTAVEVVTLLPLQGDTVIEKFYAANSWTRNYLPNKIMRIASAQPLKISVFKAMVEWLFNNPIGNAIDNLLMRITAARWNKKANKTKLTTNSSTIVMDASKHYAKPNPRNFQMRLLKRYENKISQLHIAPQNMLAN